MAEVLWVGNDNILELDELKNAATDAYVNNATVTVTLVDADDVEVVGQTWPTTMTYVSSSNGKYRGTIEDVAVLVDRGRYYANVTADGGAALKARFKLPVMARTRIDI